MGLLLTTKVAWGDPSTRTPAMAGEASLGMEPYNQENAQEKARMEEQGATGMPVRFYVVTLQSGKVLEGMITEENEKWIKIDVGLGVALTYFREEIKSIEKKPFGGTSDALTQPSKPVLKPLTVQDIHTVVEEFQKNLELRNRDQLKGLIADDARIEILDGSGKHVYSREEYLQLLFSVGGNVKDHHYQITLDRIEIKGPSATTAETVKEVMTAANGQMVEAVSKQTSVYTKIKEGQVVLKHATIDVQSPPEP